MGCAPDDVAAGRDSVVDAALRRLTSSGLGEPRVWRIRVAAGAFRSNVFSSVRPPCARGGRDV